VVTGALLNGDSYGPARRATDNIPDPEPVVVPEPVPAPIARSIDARTRADHQTPAAAAAWPELEEPVSAEHASPVLSEPEAPVFSEPAVSAFPEPVDAASSETEAPASSEFDVRHADTEAPMYTTHEPRIIPETRAIPEPTAPNLPNPAAPPLVPEPAPQPANTRVDDIAAALRRAGAEGRSVAVIGSARNVGTTLTSIALARSLSRADRVVLVDLAFSSANVDAIAEDSSGPGVAELLRGEASFGDIIIRDPGSRAHLVTAGRVGGNAQDLLQSDLLWDAVEALAQSYDYLVIDAGAHSEIALAPLAGTTPYVVLVCGDTPVVVITRLAAELQQAGFAHVAIMSGSPPALEEAAAQTAA
jgi:Mrp family chromosome partitioning ATPase